MSRGDNLGPEAVTLAVDAQTNRVVAALRAAGVEPVLLKGPAFAAWLYAGGESRSYRDTDLIVDAAQRPAAVGVLESLGYSQVPIPRAFATPSTTWVRGGVRLEVDLHTSIWGWGEPERVWTGLQAHMETMRLGPLEVLTPDETARAVHVVTHALQGYLADERANEDLERALARLADETWSRAAAFADRVRASDAFLVGLMSKPRGRAVCRRLGLAAPAQVSHDVALAARGVQGGRTLARLMQPGGLRRRAWYVLERAFPPRALAERLVTEPPAEPPGLVRTYLRYWAGLARSVRDVVLVWRRSATQDTPESSRARR